MDVTHYFEPVDFSGIAKSANHGWKYSLGKVIEKSTSNFTVSKIKKIDIAIVGIPFDNGSWNTGVAISPNIIRTELYSLAMPDSKINIVDFGNLKKSESNKGTYLAVRDIIDYLNELGIVSILLGGSQDISFGVAEAFKGKDQFTMTLLDAVLDIKLGKEPFNSSNFLTRVFANNPDIFEFNIIGYQSHMVSNILFSKIECLYQKLRLGQLKENLNQAEPVLRNTDFVSFDFGAIKSSEIGGSRQNNPNGLLSQEACQLAKFAGFSNKVKVFGLFEVELEKSTGKLAERLAAQIIWYFIEGYLYRPDQFIPESSDNTKYKVEVKGIEKPIVFYKCEKTERWWLEILTINDRKIFLACSKKDYEQASSNEIPELWLKYIQKTDKLLK